MRMIGHLPSAASAGTFSNFLYVQGIVNEVEAEKDGWVIWIHSEDQMEQAMALLANFRGNPEDPKFRREAAQADALRKKDEADKEAAERRFFDRKKVFRSTTPHGVGPLTVGLIVGCLVVAGLGWVWDEEEMARALRISNYLNGVLPEIMSGQVWRLFTPVFLHFGLLHLLFNSLWLLDLGSMIEGKEGTGRLACLVLVIAGLSNLGQYFAVNPFFGGMSGVVYGLLGYVWMKGKFDPASGLFLHPQTVTMMLIWFFLCMTGLVGRIANTAHGVGLIVGLAWGFCASSPGFRRRSR